MLRSSLFGILLLASAACSAAPAGSDLLSNPPQPAEAVRPVPRNAPLDPAIVNVRARTGRANQPLTPSPFTTTPIGQFEDPFAMAFLPDGRLLVTEKAGGLKLRGTDGSIVSVSNVPRVVRGGQGGLLDVALGPDFTANHMIYLSYAEPGANGSALALARARLAEQQVQCIRAPCPPRASLDGLKVIWRSGSNGPGGQFGSIVTFSPDGKYLFLTSGERQRFTPAQDPSQLLGKILRLTLDGKAAPGNPNYAKGGVAAMIWTTGHRNPYGLVFTPDGRLWEEEMGPRGGDELNLIEPGRNYGWPVVSNGDNYSGQPIPDHPSRPDFAGPELWWNPSISPAGMIAYSGAMFPQYQGSLFIGAMQSPGLVRVSLSGADAKPANYWDLGARIRDVAQAPDGAIWLLEDGESGGRLLRLTPGR